MRVGPGRDYQVQWLYVRKGLPVEIIQEFGNWRKVRDPNGIEGWILHSLLAGKRRVIISPWDIPAKNDAIERKKVAMHAGNSENTAIIASIEVGALADVEECNKTWCKLEVSADKDRAKLVGYIKQALLWGVYPDEAL